jgi:HTH-type transcriptional regulator, transcriptional repressor of NAD biosynthesis genes
VTGRYGHGLVIGKFYPPHRGHLYLIEAAARQCARVTVLAMAARRETVPLADRVGWLRAACAGLPGVTVAGAACDVPVMVVGAESTGTSTVARRLAAAYAGRGGAFARTACVTEAGRDYTERKWAAARAAAAAAGGPPPRLDELTWTAADFDAVAAEQTRREDQAAAGGSPLVVCDTDAFATSVWERRYRGAAARGLQPRATTGLPGHDVYLLTSHEGVPWCDDGLREGDLAIRAAMTGWFAAALTAAGHSWVLLTGSLEGRVRLARRVTDAALADRARFGAAITDTVRS